MKTFDFGAGSVPAHRHINPDGSVGGWVAETASVEPSVYIGPDALVFGEAHVYGDAQVYGRVYGNARVYGKARVYGNAQVSGFAHVSGTARVYGNALVSGKARVYDKAQVSGNARVYGDALVFGWARVSGNAEVYDKARVAHTTGLLSGTDGFYSWDAWRDEGDQIWIRYGCELHKLSDWPKLYRKLAVQHEHKEDFPGPKNVASYVRSVWSAQKTAPKS